MNFFKPILFLFIFSTLFSDYGGGYPGAILRTATNAREVSLSNSLVSAYNTGFNAFTNPSLISHGKNIEISSSLFSLPSNIYILGKCILGFHISADFLRFSTFLPGMC